MAGELQKVLQKDQAALYKVVSLPCPSQINVFIASTPESCNICNNPLLVGVKYTEALRRASAKALTLLKDFLSFSESRCVVLHILRGGINFSLREALFDAYGFNRHSSSFISAQRRRTPDNPNQWEIVESNYQKMFLPEKAQVIIGDVSATGTSLKHALTRINLWLKETGSNLSSFTFFTIGSPKALEVISQWADTFPKESIPKINLVFFEGIFTVAEDDTPLTIKISGTDLIRLNALLSPEFYQASHQDPAFPVERCVIYDAGSRAFELPLYVEDLLNYWEKILELAKQGVTYKEYFNQRFPEGDCTPFSSCSLEELAKNQIKKIQSLLVN